MTNGEAITFFEHLIPGNVVSEEATRLAIEALKQQGQRKTKEEVLLAIIGKQSYTELEIFKQLEGLNDEYFNGMLDSIRAVERLFEKDGEQE